ncbi:ABC transporter ATP-binding protein [Oryzibacter oryziterrae]|uniref:ABC transporter ATP-binding protein n=1 Tax=Oryzibacter oryziterrae TaxID=2766474 RepID=UPI001F27E59F|nr:ABC transporter ATP-binding protein [Oryzibacter oryziterrae]
MGQLNIRNLCKRFGEAEVLRDISLAIENGEFVVFVGPSGCGKSTLLRSIAGLEEVTSGDIVIDGKVVNMLPPVKRGIAMVFQSYALYPHMTVFENIAFPLRVEGLTESDVRTRVEAAAEVLHLKERLQHKPGQLSGGQRQRVAIGRAIVRQPKIFLFDEPLSNLDAALRSDMRVELLRLHNQLGSTMIYVTHDQIEAMTMADKIVVLNAGKIEQVGGPIELYKRPANRFVAEFIGSPKMNFFDGTCVDAGGATTTVEVELVGRVTVPQSTPATLAGQKISLGIRPEHIVLGAGPVTLTYKAAVVERLGLHTIVHHYMDDNGRNATGLFNGDVGVSVGDDFAVSFNPEDCLLFDAAGIRQGNAD